MSYVFGSRLWFCSLSPFSENGSCRRQPVCSCGRRKLSNLSPALQQTWAASENEKRYKLDFGNLAYLRFCKDCHKQHWPSDMRQQGPSCEPAAPVWAKRRDDADGVCKLFSGDFFLRGLSQTFLLRGFSLVSGAGCPKAPPRL